MGVPALAARVGMPRLRFSLPREASEYCERVYTSYMWLSGQSGLARVWCGEK